MCETKVDLFAVLSAACWTLAVGAVVCDLFMGGRDDVGHLGIVLSAAAATFQVRGYVVKQSRENQRAFELGREQGRLEGGGSSVPVQRLPRP